MVWFSVWRHAAIMARKGVRPVLKLECRSNSQPLTLTLFLSPHLFLLFCPSPPQAAFRTDLSVLLDQVGTGKESLSFMKRRIRRLAQQWATAANRLDAKLEQRWRDQKKVTKCNTHPNCATQKLWLKQCTWYIISQYNPESDCPQESQSYLQVNDSRWTKIFHFKHKH